LRQQHSAAAVPVDSEVVQDLAGFLAVFHAFLVFFDYFGYGFSAREASYGY